MMNLGIQLDSDSVLDYVRLFADRCREKAPILQNDSGSELPEPELWNQSPEDTIWGEERKRAVREISRGKRSSVADGRSISQEERRRKKLIDEMIKSSTNRKVVKRGVNSGKDIVIKSGEVVFPESFILSLSYMPGADAFAYPRYARSNPSARFLLRFFTRLSKEEPPRSLMVRTITTTKPKTGLAAPSTRQGTSLRRIQTSSR